MRSFCAWFGRPVAIDGAQRVEGGVSATSLSMRSRAVSSFGGAGGSGSAAGSSANAVAPSVDMSGPRLAAVWIAPGGASPDGAASAGSSIRSRKQSARAV